MLINALVEPFTTTPVNPVISLICEITLPFPVTLSLLQANTNTAKDKIKNHFFMSIKKFSWRKERNLRFIHLNSQVSVLLPTYPCLPHEAVLAALLLI